MFREAVAQTHADSAELVALPTRRDFAQQIAGIAGQFVVRPFLDKARQLGAFVPGVTATRPVEVKATALWQAIDDAHCRLLTPEETRAVLAVRLAALLRGWSGVSAVRASSAAILAA